MDADVPSYLLHRCLLGIMSHTTWLLCTERADVLLMGPQCLVQAINVGQEPGWMREASAQV